MSVLTSYFDYSINQCSPSHKDFERVVKYDSDGKEFIVYQEVDYPSLIASRGLVDDWSLNRLLSAGINPDFSVHTGYNTRIDGVDVVDEFASIADSIINDSKAE